MILKNPKDYILVGFQKSITKHKKYDAILENKKTQKQKRIPFGDSRYPQYLDKVPLQLYKSLNHYDKQRRKSYRARHWEDPKNKYSSGWFSWHYLW